MNAVRQAGYAVDAGKPLIRALLYFDVFNYPIRADEANSFAPAVTTGSFEQTLENLVIDKKIYRLDEFYSVHDKPELAERRRKGNQLAEKKLKTARAYSQLIARFPFVRGVMLSGSISKGFMDAKSDIDYFIITAPKRLWIARTSLVIFRRIFLFNSHKNFCTNYFIDLENLRIPDHNLFTATELCTLKPMYGQAAIRQFQKANVWAMSVLPQGKFEKIDLADKHFIIKRILEEVFSFSLMDRLNVWLMKQTLKFWKKKYPNVAGTNDFEIAFRTKQGVSKSHPRFFQKKALEKFERRVLNFESKHGIDLSL